MSIRNSLGLNLYPPGGDIESIERPEKNDKHYPGGEDRKLTNHLIFRIKKASGIPALYLKQHKECRRCYHR
ncbi:hypothetical protein EOK89_24545, partial [Citrobacter freundii]